MSLPPPPPIPIVRPVRSGVAMRSTTTSVGRASFAATRAGPLGPKAERALRTGQGSLFHLAEAEAFVLGEMLELFAAVDDVFGEDDAFAPGKQRTGLGRIYRAWKICRAALDSDFNADRDQLAKDEGVEPGRSRPSVFRPGAPVLRPGRGRPQ